MRHTLFYPLLLAAALLCGLTACGKIELEQPETPDKPGGTTGGGTTGGGGQTEGVLTVPQLADVADDEYVELGGYIVGYTPTKTIKGAVFGADGAVETNLLVADDPACTDYKLCAGLRLTKNTEPREALNLSANPENLGRYVVVAGQKGKYLGAPGLTKVSDYSFDETDKPGGGEDPGTTKPTSPYPTVSDAPAEVLEGC